MAGALLQGYRDQEDRARKQEREDYALGRVKVGDQRGDAAYNVLQQQYGDKAGDPQLAQQLGSEARAAAGEDRTKAVHDAKMAEVFADRQRRAADIAEAAAKAGHQDLSELFGRPGFTQSMGISDEEAPAFIELSRADPAQAIAALRQRSGVIAPRPAPTGVTAAREDGTNDPAYFGFDEQGAPQRVEGFHPGEKALTSGTGSAPGVKVVNGGVYDPATGTFTDFTDYASDQARNTALGKAQGEAQAEDLPWSKAKQNKATATIANTKQRTANLTNAIDQAAKRANWFNAGPAGKLTAFGFGTNLEGDLNTVRSIVSLDELQRLRDNSKTGGALGNVSDSEGVRLESAIAALGQAQTPGQLKQRLEYVKTVAKQAWEHVNAAYERDLKEFGGQAPKVSINNPAPRGQAPDAPPAPAGLSERARKYLSE